MKNAKSYIMAIVISFVIFGMSNVAFSKVLFVSGSWGVTEIKNEMTDDVYYYLSYINDEVQFSIVSLKGDTDIANEVWVFNKMTLLKGRSINMRVDDNPVESVYGEMPEMTIVAFQNNSNNIVHEMKMGKTLLIEVDSAFPPSIVDPITRVNLEGFAQAYYQFRKVINQ